jgi:hypothetical protein
MRQVDIVKEIGLTKQEVSLVIKKYTKPSNYDRLVSKSPEELAEFMWIRGCPTAAMCDACIKSSMDKDCKECWLEYLKQEAKE